MLSIGVTPRQLLWGKALSTAMVLILLLLPVAMVLLGVVGLTTEGTSLTDTMLRFAGMVSGYVLYLGIFLFLTLAVSAWSSSARMALLILLALWIVNVMIAPRAIDDFARAQHPTPSFSAFHTAMSADLTEAWKQTQQHFNAPRWADIPPSEFGNQLLVGARFETQVADRHFHRFWDILDRQQRIQELGGLLAPLLAIRAVSAGLAGTDLAHQRDFTDATERYRRAFELVVNTHRPGMAAIRATITRPTRSCGGKSRPSTTHRPLLPGRSAIPGQAL